MKRSANSSPSFLRGDQLSCHFVSVISVTRRD